MTEARKRKGGLRNGVDVAVVQFQQNAARNRAAQTRRQRYDAERKRVRTDCPQWLIDQLDQVAGDLNTSRNQLGAFLLTYGIYRIRQNDPELDELIDAAMIDSRNINVGCDLDLQALYDLVANSAEGSQCAE